MATTLKTDLAAHGLSQSTLYDAYPADSVSDLAPDKAEDVALALAPASFIPGIGALPGFAGAAALYFWHRSIEKYFGSINTGVADAIGLVKGAVEQCPNAGIVLAGYSQGAMVMHQAELQLASRDKAALGHIAGTLLLGDGDRVPNTHAVEFGGSPNGDEGIRTYLRGNSRQDVPLPASTANICAPDDIVCDFNLRALKRGSPGKIAAAFADAEKVHTTYAAKRTSLLDAAANWIAAKLIAADAPPPPPPAPPPPPPTPPPTVPSSGPTFVFDGASAIPTETEPDGQPGDRGFVGWAEATGQTAEVQETLPAELTAYRCVVLLTNESLGQGEASELTDYLHEGGTILAVGEHAGGMFNVGDEALNQFATSLGVEMSLNGDSVDEGPHATTAIYTSPFTTGVTALGDNWVSTLTVSTSGAAQPLVGTAEGAQTLVGEQAVGPGTFIMAGDSNMFTDDNERFYEEYDNGQFVRDMCP